MSSENTVGFADCNFRKNVLMNFIFILSDLRFIVNFDDYVSQGNIRKAVGLWKFQTVGIAYKIQTLSQATTNDPKKGMIEWTSYYYQ